MRVSIRCLAFLGQTVVMPEYQIAGLGGGLWRRIPLIVEAWRLERVKSLLFRKFLVFFAISVSWSIEIGKGHYHLFTDLFFIFHFFLLLLMPRAWSMVIRKGPLFTFHGLSSPRWSTTWIMAADLFVSLLAFRWTARSAHSERLLVRTFTLTFVLQVASVSPVSQSKGVGEVSFQDGV